MSETVREKIEKIITGREMGFLSEEGGKSHDEDLTHEQAVDSLISLFKSMVEAAKENEMIEAFDNDSHRYQIPKNKKDEWEKWLEIPSDDEQSWDVPEFAERIDGMPVRNGLDDLLKALGESK